MGYTGNFPTSLIGDKILFQSTTGVGTDADTNEKDLISYTMPISTLVSGNGIKVKVWGTTAANANTKRIRLYFGSTVLVDTTAVAANDKDWEVSGVVIGITNTTQDAIGRGNFNGSELNPLFTSPTETLSGTIDIKVSGLNGTSNANDVVAEGMLIEIIER